MALRSALLVHVHVFGVDHLVRGLARPGPCARSTRRTAARRTRSRPALLLAVHDLGQLVRRLRQALRRLLHGRRVLTLQGLLGRGDGLFELPLLVRTELLLVLVVGLLGAVDEAVELVLGLHLPAPLLVLGPVRLGLPHHALDLLV